MNIWIYYVKKGYYPYEWFDDISKMKHKGLPPIEAFDSKLSQKKLKTRRARF